MEVLPEPKAFGPYSLHAKIAQGGMAEVWLATSSQKELDGQFLAVKRLLPHLNSNKAFVDLLIHEAKIGVLLNHPCITNVIDLGYHQTDFFLTMEYIHGKSLDRILEAIEKHRAPALGPELSSYLIIEVIRGLAFAHQLKDSKGRDLNIIHRDISPGNILVSYLGEVKLADFGIATAESRLLPGFTHSALGKTSYISPEQAANEPAGKPSDIYSLGVLFCKLLNGAPPEFASVLRKCLERLPKNRPQSCSELFESIHNTLEQHFNINFNTQTTRQYYKRKLSEWMKTTFKSEILHEIDITKRALGHIQTSVQKVSNRLEVVDNYEATVFEPELADEATRYGLPTKTGTAPQSLSIEKKLRISNLEQKEIAKLKADSPELEIISEADLNKFEKTTFSTGVTYADFVRSLRIFAQKFEIQPKAIIGLIVVGVLIVGIRIARKYVTQPIVPVTKHWVQPEKVLLKVVGEFKERQLKGLTANLRLAINLKELETFFNQEFERFSQSKASVLKIELNTEPVSISNGLSQQINLMKLLNSDSLFTFLESNGIKEKLNSDGLIYIYAYPAPVSPQITSIIPDDLRGKHSEKIGAVFIAGTSIQKSKLTLALAREIAKIFGAKEKYDLSTLMPFFPNGFADPKAKPLYPQSKAELMGRSIPVSGYQKREALSIGETTIGPQTAFELGWINLETKNKLLQ